MKKGRVLWAALGAAALLVLAGALAWGLTARHAAPASPFENLMTEPEPYWKDNSGLNGASLKSAADLIDAGRIAAQGGELLSADLMSHAEYCSSVGEEAADTAYIAGGRQVWVVKIHWPHGFDHPRVGLIERCLSTTIYDAETGTPLGTVFESQGEGG
ncbi:MAG: hypothetical protein K6T75_05500 [Acetobacteraceae bacterium]|nr:hypothetical protein [Acetobacteraceae bacterium]